MMYSVGETEGGAPGTSKNVPGLDIKELSQLFDVSYQGLGAQYIY